MRPHERGVESRSARFSGCGHPRRHGDVRRTCLLAALGLFSVLSCAGRQVEAQAIRQDFWTVNGAVYAAALSGNTLYIGGEFTRMGPVTGGGVPVGAGTGTPVDGFAMVTGFVYAVAPDGAGGWYIGGSFTVVGGVRRSNLAHVLADGKVSDWAADTDYPVGVLVLDGGTLYVAGQFNTIGGQARNYLAAVDAITGEVRAWDPNPVYDPYPFMTSVDALVVVGGRVYAGGYFTAIGGEARNHIAELDSTAGHATAWNPNPDADGWVGALAWAGDVLYAGGGFTSIGGQPRMCIAALDRVTGAATAWNPTSDYAVCTLAVSGGVVYAGGSFTHIGGRNRNRIAALDATTGMATGWNPNSDNLVFSLAVKDGTVYAAGWFTNIGGQARDFAAALDAVTGLATSWDPRPIKVAGVVAVQGESVYVGGGFTGMGGITRMGIAALDVTSGRATAWDPAPLNVGVRAIVASGNLVYLAGGFTEIGGQVRNKIAALDATTALATDWNPSASGPVYALAKMGETIYACGDFTEIGGQLRHRIAALDSTTGLATDWVPALGGTYPTVYCMTPDDGTLYIGGSFTAVGGLTRNYIAALDTAAGMPTAWDPNADNIVEAIAVDGGTVYAGGKFTSIGGTARSRVAALAAPTGLAPPGAPHPAGGSPYGTEVLALAVAGDVVYVGGGFSAIGGEVRAQVAALDAATGLALPWGPDANNHVRAVVVGDSVAYIGGNFDVIADQPHLGIAAFTDAAAGVPARVDTPCCLLLRQNQPNPFTTRTLVRFSMPRADVVTLGIYDLAGRQVATLLDHVPMAPGAHEVEYRPRNLQTGVYLCRLQVGRVRESNRMVLLGSTRDRER